MATYGLTATYQDWYTSADLTGRHDPPVGPGNPRRQGWLPGVVPGRRQCALRHRLPRVDGQPDPIAYKGGGSYFDFDLPGNGLATRFDVFTQWGKDTPGFAPKSLQPADTLDGGNMEVGLNPKNYYSHTFDHSYATSYNTHIRCE